MGSAKVKSLTKVGLMKHLKALAGISEEQRASVVCSLVGHSRIITTFFGYIYCGRCGQQIGDSLGGVFDGASSVIVGHDCKACRKNAKTLTWRDTFLAKDPFPKKEAVDG